MDNFVFRQPEAIELVLQWRHATNAHEQIGEDGRRFLADSVDVEFSEDLGDAGGQGDFFLGPGFVEVQEL